MSEQYLPSLAVPSPLNGERVRVRGENANYRTTHNSLRPFETSHPSSLILLPLKGEGIAANRKTLLVICRPLSEQYLLSLAVPSPLKGERARVRGF